MIARAASYLPPTCYASSAMPVDSETVPVGQAAPDFELTSIAGDQVRLSSLRGKPVVLVFLRGFM